MNWTKAQGRVVKGLVNRRTTERKLCLEGASEPKIPISPPAEIKLASAEPVGKHWWRFW
jgi:lysozyme